jgi:hypothetical protein
MAMSPRKMMAMGKNGKKKAEEEMGRGTSRGNMSKKAEEEMGGRGRGSGTVKKMRGGGMAKKMRMGGMVKK